MTTQLQAPEMAAQLFGFRSHVNLMQVSFPEFTTCVQAYALLREKLILLFSFSFVFAIKNKFEDFVLSDCCEVQCPKIGFIT